MKKNICVKIGWAFFSIVLLGYAEDPVPPLPEENIPIDSPLSVMTLERCLELVEKQNLGSQGMALEYYIRDFQSKQVGARPNPEIESEFENFAGTGGYSGVEGLETSLGIKQEFELGSKRAKRESAGNSYRDISAWEYEEYRRQLRNDVKTNFIEVLAGQEKLKLFNMSYQLQEKLLEYSSKRHVMGKSPVTEQLKANIQLSLTHMEMDGVSREWMSAKQNLATLWSSEKIAFDSVVGDLFAPIQVPRPDVVFKNLSTNPKMLKMEKEKTYLEQMLILERAAAIPNLGLGVGSKFDAAENDMALKASISLGLPLWNRNKAGIKSVALQIRQKKIQQDELQMNLRNEISVKLSKLSSLKESLEHLEKEILPEAEKTERAILESFEAGRTSQLEVMDSQRVLLESRKLYVGTRLEYLKNILHLENISGIEFVHFNN